MIYFDTDVLILSIIEQDPIKHTIAKEYFLSSIENKSVSISLLSIQEIAFVLGKLKVSPDVIKDKVLDFLDLNPLEFNKSIYPRALELASKIGFQNINDCLHVAIAELYCKELYTFNKNDFEKLKPLTPLSIQIF